jgi:hypothetical protein
MKTIINVKISVPFLFLLLVWGCVNQTNQKDEVQAVRIDTLYTFTEFDSHGIAQPTDVEILEDGQILVSDYGTDKITSLNKNGNVNYVFGREGRGPGEFLNINDVFELNKQVMVFDNHLYKISAFDYQGKFLKSHTLPKDIFNKELALINDSLYVVGLEGLEDSLFQIQSFTSDYKLQFEETRFKREGRIDMKKNKNQLKAGNIPNLYKNKVILRADEKHIYVFFEGYSEMSKYDLSGNLVWNKTIELPFNDEIFNRAVENAKTHTNPRSMPGITYILEFKPYEQGIYILTSSSLKRRQQFVKLDHNGEMSTIYTLPDSTTVYDFDIDFENEMAYFTSWNYGIVGRAEL